MWCKQAWLSVQRIALSQYRQTVIFLGCKLLALECAHPLTLLLVLVIHTFAIQYIVCCLLVPNSLLLMCCFYMSSWDAFAAQSCKPTIFGNSHLLVVWTRLSQIGCVQGSVWTLVPSVVSHAPDTSFCLQPCFSGSAVSQWQTRVQHCRNTIHT